MSKYKHSTNKYAVLMETSGKEFESWYYCIKYNGNEEALQYLDQQLNKFDWFIYEDLSTFDLDLDHLISEQTAKELTSLELNVYFNRKFDGTLKKINLKFKPKPESSKKEEKWIIKCMSRAFDKLSYGQIQDFIDEEDEKDETSSEEYTESSDEEEEEEEEGEGANDDKKEEKVNIKHVLNLPTNFKNLPTGAKKKRRGKHKK